ncbi:MAG TPA: SDR family NAD(P)-dependent oxidoreductase [Candidatus Limnocylindria bacterium]|nr:SDR family NAD(P)-dependent oxidoreductase [Candidatus Limnocylindria bacterium]
MRELDGRVAMVTGGAGRLGRAIVDELARAGAAVGVLDARADAGTGVARELAASGIRAAAATADVSSGAEVERAVDELESAVGPIDVLVNAHGIFPNIPVLEVTEEEWDRVFAVNVRGTMLTCRAVARRLIERGAPGAIVNISSGAATSARAGGAAYNGSKAAVNQLTHVLAIELGPHRIRVNAVAPGLILDDVLRDETHPSEYVRLMLRGTPLRRTGAAADIAPAVAFLASDRSPWTTGAILEITGGSHTGRPHVPLSRDLR